MKIRPVISEVKPKRGGVKVTSRGEEKNNKREKELRSQQVKERKQLLKMNPSQRFFDEARSKIIQRKFEELNGKDLLGIYLAAYLKRFNQEDPDFVKHSTFVRERGLINNKVVNWFQGDHYKMYRYIVNTLDWWKHRLESGYGFPDSLPTFKSMFISNHFFKNYNLHCKEINISID